MAKDYRQYISREISIGSLKLGGNQPVRLQSMTSANTMDTNAIMAQCRKMLAAGCALIRITAPGVKEAGHLSVIKKNLIESGYDVPLIADIHYSPKAAEIAATIVEKVRINPGNYTDKKRGKTHWTEEEYQDDIKKIESRLLPLIEICKKHNTAMRIGANHGSLSERIMARYGDTADGMVESALEFVRICRKNNYHQLVLSMKSSNTGIMIYASRLLVQKMMEEGMDYPLHLGVTEAGEGADGRIKSALGIGTLLAEGIGNTIRVSLTEDPEFELPVAKKIVDQNRTDNNQIYSLFFNPFGFERRKSRQVLVIGGDQIPRVFSTKANTKPQPDYELIEQQQDKITFRSHQNENIKGLYITKTDIIPDKDATLLIAAFNNVSQYYQFFEHLHQHKIDTAVVLAPIIHSADEENYQLKLASIAGNLFSNGFGDGIWLHNEFLHTPFLTQTAFAVLQAARRRFSRTEYISCPSCGRTQYNIQDAVQKVKAATSHLSGITIGVMGCIVNGPGEMAGADYGYVGAGNKTIVLFKGKEAVSEKIPEHEAVQRLVELIKANGDWKEAE